MLIPKHKRPPWMIQKFQVFKSSSSASWHWGWPSQWRSGWINFPDTGPYTGNIWDFDKWYNLVLELYKNLDICEYLEYFVLKTMIVGQCKFLYSWLLNRCKIVCCVHQVKAYYIDEMWYSGELFGPICHHKIVCTKTWLYHYPMWTMDTHISGQLRYIFDHMCTHYHHHDTQNMEYLTKKYNWSKTGLGICGTDIVSNLLTAWHTIISSTIIIITLHLLSIVYISHCGNIDIFFITSVYNVKFSIIFVLVIIITIVMFFNNF